MQSNLDNFADFYTWYYDNKQHTRVDDGELFQEVIAVTMKALEFKITTQGMTDKPQLYAAYQEYQEAIAKKNGAH